MTPPVPIQDQIKEVVRELAMREKVYPLWIEQKRMKQADADLHIERMFAVLRTLEWLRDNEAKIKAKVEAA